MIPTLGPIVETLGTGSAGFAQLATVVIILLSVCRIQPGVHREAGLIMAAYMTASDSAEKDKEQNRLFGRLFMIAIVCVIANAVLSAVGIYGIIV